MDGNGDGVWHSWLNLMHCIDILETEETITPNTAEYIRDKLLLIKRLVEDARDTFDEKT